MKTEKSRNIKADEVKNYLEESRGLERDYLGEIVKSRKKAWYLSYFFGGLATLGLIAGIAGLQREAPRPLILRVDNATGNVDVVSAMREHEQSYGEIVDEYFLNRYILSRESYDYNTIQLDYDTTALMSSADVQQEYYKLFEGANARDAVYANKTRIVPTVRSIQPNGNGQATIRFSTKEIQSNGARPTVRNWIATVGYSYVSAPMKLEDRRINPLGFQVTSYRVDSETLN